MVDSEQVEDELETIKGSNFNSGAQSIRHIKRNVSWKSRKRRELYTIVPKNEWPHR